MDEIQPMGTLPLTWKKAFFIIYIHYMVMKYSHLRGKKLPNTPLKKLKKEILPLTWEKAIEDFEVITQGRNTPTYVGKSFWGVNPLLAL